MRSRVSPLFTLYYLSKVSSLINDCHLLSNVKSKIDFNCRDNLCGMLHCYHLNERLQFGMESAAIIGNSFGNSNGTIIPCRSVRVNLGLGHMDPGLVPNGAKCAPDKVIFQLLSNFKFKNRNPIVYTQFKYFIIFTDVCKPKMFINR